jgi:hypothetical protein
LPSTSPLTPIPKGEGEIEKFPLDKGGQGDLKKEERVKLLLAS